MFLHWICNHRTELPILFQSLKRKVIPEMKFYQLFNLSSKYSKMQMKPVKLEICMTATI